MGWDIRNKRFIHSGSRGDDLKYFIEGSTDYSSGQTKHYDLENGEIDPKDPMWETDELDLDEFVGLSDKQFDMLEKLTSFPHRLIIYVNEDGSLTAKVKD
jgi:hypothetical protein